MAVPMKNGGMKVSKVIYYVVLSGVTTGIGAFIGAIIGTISQEIIAICLAFAAGAMIYIVSGELTPESNKLYQGRMSAIGNILGFIIGVFAMNIWKINQRILRWLRLYSEHTIILIEFPTYKAINKCWKYFSNTCWRRIIVVIYFYSKYLLTLDIEAEYKGLIKINAIVFY